MKKQIIIVILLFIITFILLDNFYFHIVKRVKETIKINSLVQELTVEAKNDIMYLLCEKCKESELIFLYINSVESGGLQTWTECYIKVWYWVQCKKCDELDFISKTLEITANADEMVKLKIYLQKLQIKKNEEEIIRRAKFDWESEINKQEDYTYTYENKELSWDLISKNGLSTAEIKFKLGLIYTYDFDLPQTEGYYELESKIEKNDRYIEKVIKRAQELGAFNDPNGEEIYELLLDIIRDREKLWNELFKNIEINLKIDSSRDYIEKIKDFMHQGEDIVLKQWTNISKVIEESVLNSKN